jgi:DNA-binding CsgD family transcriptional regulator/PAS domain-containing protein
MGKGVDAERLLAINNRLGDAAIDPMIWPELLDLISNAVGAAGAALLQSDVRTSDIPRSAGAGEVISSYFANGWQTQDVRAERGVPLLLRGQKVVTDQDIVTPQEMGRLGLYTEVLAPFGFQWFAAIGFWSGSALWGLTIQRRTQEGPFGNEDKRALAQLSQRLTEVATLSAAVGRAVISGVTNALHKMQQPVLALDRLGFVIDMNAAAEQLFDDEFSVRDRRLRVRDQRARLLLDDFIDQLKVTPDTVALPTHPIVVQRLAKRPLVIRILPVDGAARTPFLGARALLVVSDLNPKSKTPLDLLSQTFGLSPAEARLASLMATGASPEQAAEQLGIARETARTQLKAVFTKTGTHRQSELVALLSRL